jgi:flavin reductase (DIM6/NTAB) family NADH-FMN oxidoreductase RutF
MVDNAPELRRALDLWNRGRFVLTSAFEQKRAGVIVESAQPCSWEPPLVCVICRKGHPIGPIIRDSHRFAVCEVDPLDKTVARRFAFDGHDRGDPFDVFEHDRMATGSPVLKRSLLILDCDVYRHLDLECEHELYIGSVRAARVNLSDVGRPLAQAQAQAQHQPQPQGV